jgi:hypothetical protein
VESGRLYAPRFRGVWETPPVESGRPTLKKLKSYYQEEIKKLLPNK